MSDEDIGVYMHVDGFEKFDSGFDFNKREVRNAMQRAGRIVRDEARALLSRGGPSRPGEYPGRRTGKLSRAIRAKTSRSGFLVRVQPKTGAALPMPYFAYLHYGVRRGAKRRRDRQAQPSGPYRIAPRANYMQDALQRRASDVREILSNALRAALNT